jgi:hypothetical protein
MEKIPEICKEEIERSHEQSKECLTYPKGSKLAQSTQWNAMFKNFRNHVNGW